MALSGSASCAMSNVNLMLSGKFDFKDSLAEAEGEVLEDCVAKLIT